jgi:hypothetical protein
MAGCVPPLRCRKAKKTVPAKDWPELGFFA